MQTRLTRGEYWLLETAVDALIPISFLCAENYSKPDGIVAQFNKPGHGLKRNDLVATLTSLFSNGLLEPFREDEPCAMSDKEIRSALDEEWLAGNAPNLLYGLTERGGTVWEEFAAPQWDRCIVDARDYETRTGTITCMDLRRLTRYVTHLHLMGIDVQKETLTIEPRGAWSPTYWKDLPNGHEARFHWLSGPHPTCEFAFAGICQLRDGWYRWR